MIIFYFKIVSKCAFRRISNNCTLSLHSFIQQPHHRPPQSPSSDDLKSPSFMQEWERIRTQRQLKSPSTKASSVSPKSNDGQVPEFMRLAAKFRAKRKQTFFRMTVLREMLFALISISSARASLESFSSHRLPRPEGERNKTS